LFWWVFPWLVQWLTPQLRWSMAKNDNHVTGASTWSASKCRSPIYSGNHRGHLQSSSVYFFQWQKLIYIYIYINQLFNIAMGNGPFIDGVPIKNGWIFHGELAMS
jgi:hypothetical protein